MLRPNIWIPYNVSLYICGYHTMCVCVCVCIYVCCFRCTCREAVDFCEAFLTAKNRLNMLSCGGGPVVSMLEGSRFTRSGVAVLHLHQSAWYSPHGPYLNHSPPISNR